MLVEQGDLDETQSLYEEALTAYNEALEIYSKVQDARGIIKVYLRIANIHYHVGNLELSRKGCIDALTLAESNRLHNLKADVLVQIGELDLKTGKFQIALERFQQSLQIAVERKDKFRQESTLGRIGRVYESVGEYSIALEYWSTGTETLHRDRA